MKSEPKFACSRCGACCQQLELFGEKYKWLDNGNGTCMYFDTKTKLCSVYEIRPVICRVEDGYGLYFSEISFEEYIRLTNKACKVLQKRLIGKNYGNS